MARQLSKLDLAERESREASRLTWIDLYGEKQKAGPWFPQIIKGRKDRVANQLLTVKYCINPRDQFINFKRFCDEIINFREEALRFIQ